ncbi:MAG: hypothetical protein H6R26_1110 [Proteobacteria bacterium]|nr:hypothetical protein [Pseudomonadota bacterium]
MEQIFPNGVAHYLTGGLTIGAAVGLLFVMTGLIGGMSTVYSSTWSYISKQPFFQQERFTGSRAWRLAYAAGLVLGGFAWMGWSASGTWQTGVPWWQLAVGGFLVGFGARMSNGCTSGHGICGLASLQLPSLLAVLTFLTTAIVTAQLVVRLGGV